MLMISLLYSILLKVNILVVASIRCLRTSLLASGVLRFQNALIDIRSNSIIGVPVLAPWSSRNREEASS
jgi:hypothetical protein